MKRILCPVFFLLFAIPGYCQTNDGATLKAGLNNARIRLKTSFGAVDANAIPINKDNADASFAAAACIGCGACVAACKNSSAMLFVSAKVTHLALLPQGDPERRSRALNMVAQMDKEGFGGCTNTGACEAVCPKEISIDNIARLNKEYLVAGLISDK